MSECYHRGIIEQWQLYLKLTPRALFCASNEKHPHPRRMVSTWWSSTFLCSEGKRTQRPRRRWVFG
jgi:hypothetical protein